MPLLRPLSGDSLVRSLPHHFFSAIVYWDGIVQSALGTFESIRKILRLLGLPLRIEVIAFVYRGAAAGPVLRPLPNPAPGHVLRTRLGRVVVDRLEVGQLVLS